MDSTYIQKGATYIRVSTHMQDELSPDAQKRLLLEYAEQNHIAVSPEHMYEDSGISGRRADKRPQFLRMVADAKSASHPFDVILVWKFSRFARNQEESIVYKSLLNRQCGVSVVSVTEPVTDGPFGSLIERIIEWMDEYYSIRLSGEVKRGMTEKALRGGYQSRPPLGYRIGAKKEPPAVVPEEARIVQYIFDQYVNCRASPYSIAKDLNARHFKTSRGGDFERRSVEYILQNPIYCGLIRWNRTEHATSRIRDEQEWVLVPGSHEPIIPMEVFQKAQERFQTEKASKTFRPSASGRHWLSGLLKCPRCGRSMTSCRTGKYRYFVCYGYLKGTCSCSTHLSQPAVQEAVLSSIRETLGQTPLLFQYQIPRSSLSLDERSHLEEELSRLSHADNRIREAYRRGVDTLEEYREQKERLNRERQLLLSRITQLEKQEDAPPKPPQAPPFLGSVYELLCSEADFDLKGLVLRAAVEKIIYIKEEDTLKVYYRCADSAL